MNLNEYQIKARETWNPGSSDAVESQPLLYCCLALAGEAGEVANEAKKMLRDSHGKLTDKRRDRMIDELGDCLWYVTMAADRIDCTLEVIANLNIQKLRNRYI